MISFEKRYVAATLLLFVFCLARTGKAQSTSGAYTEASLLATKAPGVYAKPAPSAKTIFKPGEPVVSAGYWYDPRHVAARTAPDPSLFRHPAPGHTSPRDLASWHYNNLRDMRVAGLNMVLAVYTGDAADDQRPNALLHYASAGLPPLVKADESLRRQTGKALPIGMFYDTATLRQNADNYQADLSTPAGRAWFYIAIRNFYSCIPPALRATVGGKPLVFICPTNYLESNGAGDPRVLDYVRLRFRADFGVEPYLIAHDVWRFPNADAQMSGDSRDPLFTEKAVAFSPGWRQPPLTGPLNPETDRARGTEGSRYRGYWEQMLALPAVYRPDFVFLDSWNEWGNDTALAPSREFGDTYVRLTRHYADIFTGRAKPLLASPYRNASLISLLFDPELQSQGVTLVTTPKDGQSKLGTGYVETIPPAPYHCLQLYFAVDGNFRGDTAGNVPAEVMIEYWDEGQGELWFQYDSLDSAVEQNGAYKQITPIPGTFTPGTPGTFRRTDTKTWKSVIFHLPDAAFLHRQNGGADFRITTPESEPLRVRWVTVRKIEPIK